MSSTKVPVSTYECVFLSHFINPEVFNTKMAAVNSTSVQTKLPHSLNGPKLYGVTNVLIVLFALSQNVCRSV